MSTGYLAIDLGAESGRVIVGVLENDRLRLEESHRFLHECVWLPTGLHWDITRHLARNRRRACGRPRPGRKRMALNLCRLASTRGESIGPSSIGPASSSACLMRTVTQEMRPPTRKCSPNSARSASIKRPASSSCRSIRCTRSMRTRKPIRVAFEAAESLLFIPDLFHYWLSGERTIEATIASTSQMIDCHTGDWARDMLRGTIAANQDAGTNYAARDRDRDHCARNWPTKPVADEHYESSRRLRTIRPAPWPQYLQRRDQAGVICRAARGRCWALRFRSRACPPRLKPHRSPTNLASTARFDF